MNNMNRLNGRLSPASLAVSTAAAMLAVALVHSSAGAQTTVFSTGFESPTYSVGNLIPGNSYFVPGQDDWVVYGSGTFNTSTYQIAAGNGSGAGTQSMQTFSPPTAGTKEVVRTIFYDTGAPAGQRGYNNRGAGQGLITVSFDMRINSGTVASRLFGLRLDSDFDPAITGSQDTEIGAFEVRPGTTNQIFVQNYDDLGFGSDPIGQINTGGAIPSNTWTNVKYELDYRVRRARVLVNDVQVGKYYTFQMLRETEFGSGIAVQNRLSDLTLKAARNFSNPNLGNDSVQFDNVSVVASTLSPDWVFTYNANLNGNWTSNENWFKRTAPTVRPVADVSTSRLDVLFPDIVTAPRIVTVDATFDPNAPARAVDTIKFDSALAVNSADPLSSSYAYTIGGLGVPGATNPSILAFSPQGATPSIHVVRGAHRFLAAVALPNSPTIRVENGGVLRLVGEVSIGNNNSGEFFFKEGNGTLALPQFRIGTLFVDDGMVVLTGGEGFNGVSRTNDLFLQNANSRVDVRGTTTLLLDSDSNPINTVRDYVRDGKIIHTGETDSRVVLGYALVTTIGTNVFGDLTADSTTVVLKRVLKGDSNFDNAVNFDDLLSLAANYNQSSKVWREGDFNYDGAVNFDDLLGLAANYNQMLTGTVDGDFALAQSLIPEPTSALALVGAAVSTLRRRRR
jgi:hypothetical protein